MKKKLKAQKRKTHIIQKQNWPVDKPNSPLPLADSITMVNDPKSGGQRWGFPGCSFQASSPKSLELVQIQPTSPMTCLGLVPHNVGPRDLQRLFSKVTARVYLCLCGRQRRHVKHRPRGVWELTLGLNEAVPQRINSSDTNGRKTRLTWNSLPGLEIPPETAVLLSCFFCMPAPLKSLTQKELPSDCSIMWSIIVTGLLK